VTLHAMSCPFCDSADVEVVSAWGGQLITSQLRCRDCNSYFEALRDEQVLSGGPWTSSSEEGQ
jgi:transcriptional regulator NrdR family protein